MFSVPPRRLAAFFVSRNGARTTSKWRFSERSVHSGDFAFSTSDSCWRTLRTVSTVAALAAGIAVGSMSSLLTWRATPIGSRNPPATRSRSDSAADGSGGGGATSTASGSIGGGGRRVAVEVEERQRHLHAALAVGDRVVHLLHERGLAAAQALDDGELPQRPHPVEAVVDEQRGEIEQLAHRTRLGERDPPDVVVDVEVRIVDPRRSRQVDGRRLHPPAQPRHRPRRPLHPRPEDVEVGRPVEHGHGAERRAEVRILVDPPHQPFGIRHLAVVAHAADALTRRHGSIAPRSGSAAAQNGARSSA